MKIYRMKNNDFAFTAVPCALANCTPGHIRLSDGPIYYPTSHGPNNHHKKYGSKEEYERSRLKPVRLFRDGFSAEFASVGDAAKFLRRDHAIMSKALTIDGYCYDADKVRYFVEFIKKEG
jgi:hypothetical protein